jgi:hypothetical protein
MKTVLERKKVEKNRKKLLLNREIISKIREEGKGRERYWIIFFQ